MNICECVHVCVPVRVGGWVSLNVYVWVYVFWVYMSMYYIIYIWHVTCLSNELYIIIELQAAWVFGVKSMNTEPYSFSSYRIRTCALFVTILSDIVAENYNKIVRNYYAPTWYRFLVSNRRKCDLKGTKCSFTPCVLACRTAHLLTPGCRHSNQSLILPCWSMIYSTSLMVWFSTKGDIFFYKII